MSTSNKHNANLQCFAHPAAALIRYVREQGLIGVLLVLFGFETVPGAPKQAQPFRKPEVGFCLSKMCSQIDASGPAVFVNVCVKPSCWRGVCRAYPRFSRGLRRPLFGPSPGSFADPSWSCSERPFCLKSLFEEGSAKPVVDPGP